MGHDIDNGGPAFPVPYEFMGAGLSLRDYLAAKAMQAMVASDSYEAGDWGQEDIAEQSYQMADTMLKARTKEPA